MPQNRFIYIGVLIVAAVALIYLANKFTTFVMPILPWAGGAGIVLILAGIFWEAKKGSPGAGATVTHSLRPGDREAESIKETVV